MQGKYLYKYPVFICILPCCPGQYTNKSLPFIMNNQSKSYTSFDPAKHSEKISPFNTNIEIYSATIENTVVSHISCRLCVYSKKILSLWILQTSNSGTQHCLILSQSRCCHLGKIFLLRHQPTDLLLFLTRTRLPFLLRIFRIDNLML